MRTLSYRTKRKLQKGLKIGLILAAVFLLLLILLTVYLQRFVVYSADGIYLDFGRSTASYVAPTGEPGPTEPLPDAEIVYGDPSAGSTSAADISGYYIDLDMLDDPQKVLDALKALEGPCTVMIDLKSRGGSFYYSTGIEDAPRADTDVATVDAVLSYLKTNGFTMVAKVPAFVDTSYAERHSDCALQTTWGDLWVGDGHYWLKPYDSTVIAYLKQIARELAGKGFKEIVFDDFYFPDASQITYESERSRSELIQDTASDLLNFFASSNITISFGDPTSDFDPVSAASHVFISDIDGSRVNGVVSSFTKLEDPQAQIVFLTSSRDTRFEGYHLLRPLV